MENNELARQLSRVLAGALSLLLQGAEAATAEIGTRFGAAAWELAVQCWKRLRAPVAARDGADEAARELADKPDDDDLRGAFAVQLRRLLDRDPSLARELATLVEQAPPEARYRAEGHGQSVIAQDHGVAARQVAVGEIVNGPIVIAEGGASVVIGEPKVTMKAVDRGSALEAYLRYVISQNRFLELQGIRSGGRAVTIELEQIFIRLHATRERSIEAEEQFLAGQRELAPGEGQRKDVPAGRGVEFVTVAAEEALAEFDRLVILGGPGSGKTTLLRYLAARYARDLADGTHRMQAYIAAHEPPRLPVVLSLRQLAHFIASRVEDGTEGAALLLDFLRSSLANAQVEIPADFFDVPLADGSTVWLLDGLDEVADPKLRRRIARLVESLTARYPNCRYVVTSRIVGYEGATRLGERYAATTVKDFTLADVRAFLGTWHRLLAVGRMGAGPQADADAAGQTVQLVGAIEGNERIRELAINPLMLTVIAMVHRDRVQLPDRRAELYAEAVEVLLGKWDEAKKGGEEFEILPDRVFDIGDRRLFLQDLALHMHERQQREIEIADLRDWLLERFAAITSDTPAARKATERFLKVIEERTGLLVARGEGVYAFSHLTFQEYLAAVAIAARSDFSKYSLARVADPWWREVILLEAGCLSMQGAERTAALVRAIADSPKQPRPYHNLVLAATCVNDAGANRVGERLHRDIMTALRQGVEKPPPLFSRLVKRAGIRAWIDDRAAAMEALGRAGQGFWRPPYGEPEWIDIPAGDFRMGSEVAAGWSDERPVHEVRVAAFSIARTPVSNAQYRLFTRNTGHPPPRHWDEDRPPRGGESHPVVNVSWDDALAYCRWLGSMLGKPVCLPSEAEWERGARGNTDAREYPWGNRFDRYRCNCAELGYPGTTPVGIFPEGASLDGCLDMVGNVWEWTRSRWEKYPYPPPGAERAARESLEAADARVVRGGGCFSNRRYVRCAYRNYNDPDSRFDYIGFRVVVSPFFSDR